MKKLIVIYLFIISGVMVAQDYPALYKGLIYKMPIDAAKKEFKQHKDLYVDISFGNGVEWRLYTQNFGVVNDSLTSLVLKPKGALLGLTHEAAKVYLNNSFEFFTKRGYQVIKEPQFWNVPIYFDATNKFGLVMHNPDKTVVVELRSVQLTGTSYLVNLGISNYDAFLRFLTNDEAAVNNQQNQTGF